MPCRKHNWLLDIENSFKGKRIHNEGVEQKWENHQNTEEFNEKQPSKKETTKEKSLGGRVCKKKTK